VAWAGACWVLGWEVKVPEVNKGQAEEKGSPHTLVSSFHLKPRTVPYTSHPPTLSGRISWPQNQSHWSWSLNQLLNPEMRGASNENCRAAEGTVVCEVL